MRHSGKRCFPAIFLRTLSGSVEDPPAPLAPHSAGLRLADCGLPKVTRPVPRRARPDSPRAARTGSPSSATPRRPLPPHSGAGPGDPSKGARPSHHCRSPPAQQASLPAGPEPPRSRTHRRGDSVPPPAGPGQAHVRARLPRRRYAAMAARAELGVVPPSPLPSLLPGLRSPRGRGLSRPYPCRGAGWGREGAGRPRPAPLLSCGPGGARQRWGGGTQTLRPWSCLGAGVPLGSVRDEGSAVTSPNSTHRPWRALRGGARLPAVPCRPPWAAAPPQLASRHGSGRFVTVAKALRAGSGVCHSL